MNQAKAKKIGVALALLLGILLLLACADAGDTQTNVPTPDHRATLQAILSATPTPTPTLVHRITDIVTHHKSDDGYSHLWGVITGVMQTGNAYRVDVTLDGGNDNEVQQDAYVVLDALYASNLKPSQVTVRMFGPCTDKYGNQSTCQWAVAMLTDQTEKLFHWPGLDYQSAWADYDQAEYLVNGL